MAEMNAMQMLMGYYDELTEGIEVNDQEALANLQAETNPEIEQEGTKQEHVNVELTTDYAKTENLNQLNTTDNKTQPFEEAASAKKEAEGSSSVEPEWGRFTERNEKEIEEDYHTWKTVNVGGYTSQRTTQAYRHGRCYMCSKPVSTTNLDPEVELFCQECGKDLTELDCGFDDSINPKRGMERRDRDDEEEWGRVPIPQSDDSDDEPWLDESHSPESEQKEEDVIFETPAMGKEKFTRIKKAQKILLSAMVPVETELSGRKTDHSLIIIDDTLYSETLQTTQGRPKEKGELPEKDSTSPRWSPLLMRLQRQKLKMKYKTRTKVRAKLMRSIRKHVPKKEHIRWEKTNSVTTNKLRQLLPLIPSSLTQWDTTRGFINQTYPEGGVLVQCMNAIRSPNRDTRKTKRMLKLPIHSKLAKRSRPAFSPIAVPGTPENQQYKNKFETAEEKQDEDLDLYYKFYAKYKPEMGESNAESVERTDAIETEYKLRKDLRKTDRKEEKRVNESKHTLSPFQLIKPAPRFKSLRPPSPIVEPMVLNPTEENPYKTHVQQVTIETDHGLYDNPDKPLRNEPIQVIYDTGASISMLPAEYATAWANLRECLHTLTACFSGHTEKNLIIGELHGIFTLDSGETVKAIIPECIQIPPGLSNTYLLADSAFLMAGHQYVSHLSKPKLKFKGGDSYTMSVTRGHKLITILPIRADSESTHRQIYLHNNEPYDPPTYINNTLYQCTNQPNANTPTAFTWHLRYACKSAQVLKHTQGKVDGLNIQHGTLKDLDKLTPCSACLAGKMRKLNHPPTKNFTEVNNLTTVTGTSTINAPLSWTPSTEHKLVNHNETISVDWGIINKKAKANVKNVFALFLDTNTGNVFVYAAESRGQAGPALEAYIQKYGKPQEVVHDNAQEFMHGTFKDICLKQLIKQTKSPPFDPNKNPVEHYMDILTCMMRSMLFISGLNPEKFWEDALQQATHIQVRTALPGRCTPYELTCGRRPDVTNLRIFGCEALSYIERTKRSNLQPKVERAIYLGISPDHSHDTYKLLRISNNEIIFRRNVYFNERSFLARKMKLPTTLTSIDTGADLVGLDFDDEGQTWTITEIGMYDEERVLYYKNKQTGEEEKSSVKEVRQWYNRTHLMQAANSITPTRKGFINTLAETSYKTITAYDVKLPAHASKPTSYKKAGNSPFPQWFRAEEKRKKNKGS
jgi:hypothetical protein